MPEGPSDESPPADDATADRPLRRAISRRMLVLLVVGDVLGAGIYALVGQVAGRVGGAIWAAFALALSLAMLTALAYAELVTKYPRAAGAALYVNRAWQRPFLTFLVAFAVMSSGLASAATLARAVGGRYLGEFVDVPVVAAALVFLVIVTLVNLRGIADSARINVVLTLVELSGLVLVVVVGGAAIAGGGSDIDLGRVMRFDADGPVALSLLGGAGLAFFALIGFEDSVNLAEETRHPTRDFPPALIGGLVGAGVLYLAVGVIASAVVPTDRLAASDGPLLEVVGAGPWPLPGRLFALVALCALANGALINLVMASRILYGLAGEGILPAAFGRVLPGRRTPWVAIAATAAVTAVLVTSGDLGELADTTVLLLLLVFALVNVAVLVLRRDHVDHHHFRAPTVVPVLGVVASLGLTATKSPGTFLRTGALLLLGVLLAGLNTWRRRATER